MWQTYSCDTLNIDFKRENGIQEDKALQILSSIFNGFNLLIH